MALAAAAAAAAATVAAAASCTRKGESTGGEGGREREGGSSGAAVGRRCGARGIEELLDGHDMEDSIIIVAFVGRTSERTSKMKEVNRLQKSKKKEQRR